MLDRAEHDGRAFEVVAADPHVTLGEIVAGGLSPEAVRKLISGLSGILSDLGRLGLRH